MIPLDQLLNLSPERPSYQWRAAAHQLAAKIGAGVYSALPDDEQFDLRTLSCWLDGEAERLLDAEEAAMPGRGLRPIADAVARVVRGVVR